MGRVSENPERGVTEARPDGPASDVVQYRDKQSRLHRDDGPAVIYPSGTCAHYHHGRLHRVDGPAIYGSPYESDRYYLLGQRLDEREVERAGLDAFVMKLFVTGKIDL